MKLKDSLEGVKAYLNYLFKENKQVVILTHNDLEIILKHLNSLDCSVRDYTQFLIDTKNTRIYKLWVKNQKN